uniref:Secreted protein n=1 Tax=Anguilla anguilla TaxID=7936 RepID=A0A0E9WR33_ANGAN
MFPNIKHSHILLILLWNKVLLSPVLPGIWNGIQAGTRHRQSQRTGSIRFPQPTKQVNRKDQSIKLLPRPAQAHDNIHRLNSTAVHPWQTLLRLESMTL